MLLPSKLCSPFPVPVCPVYSPPGVGVIFIKWRASRVSVLLKVPSGKCPTPRMNTPSSSTSILQLPASSLITSPYAHYFNTTWALCWSQTAQALQCASMSHVPQICHPSNSVQTAWEISPELLPWPPGTAQQPSSLLTLQAPSLF